MTATAKINKKPWGDRPSKPSKLDSAKYGRLLAETLPAVITNESEYDRVAALTNRLAVIPEDRITPEQERLLDLLTLLIEAYDEEHYQIPDAAPHEVIQLLMRERGLRNKDLEPALGSRGVTSEVISGKRRPSKTQIKKLAEFFGVAPAVFISLV
ncbi:MAG TPA: helix-turn-helix domain-containing protein [Blastocatellia bacterium]|nr:helix-turn-helix domain-containing protein [Blastocatellia bacterium]